jgi:hypothetical protein
VEKVEGGEGQSHCLGCLMHQDLGYGVGQGDDIRKLWRERTVPLSGREGGRSIVSYFRSIFRMVPRSLDFEKLDFETSVKC